MSHFYYRACGHLNNAVTLFYEHVLSASLEWWIYMKTAVRTTIREILCIPRPQITALELNIKSCWTFLYLLRPYI